MDQVSKSDFWGEIDLSERYMICGMFNEASCLACSVIQRLRASSVEVNHETQLADAMNSAGMVFVQSLRELGRTSELFDELKMLFDSVDAIPIEVFLTGACMQISEGLATNLIAIFEEFLNMWRYLDDDLYVYPKEEMISSQCSWQSALNSGKYLEAVEIFTVTILGKVLRKPELAISWTEMAGLPHGKRQDILRRLRSLHFISNSCSSLNLGAVQNVDRVEPPSGFVEFPKAGKSNTEMNGNVSNFSASKTVDPSVKKYFTRLRNLLSWFSSIRLKFGSIHLVLPSGKVILLGLFMAFASHSLRKKSSGLKQFAWRQALWMQKTVIDAWELAFSVQMNPLAAVQQLPAAPR